MKKKYIYAGLSALVLALYLVVPACGSKSNTAATPTPYPLQNPNGLGNCLQGICTGINGVGLPLLEGPVISVADGFGSIINLQISAPQVQTGGVYSGPVNIVGSLNIVGGVCPPPGNYQIQGQGVYQTGYANADGGVQANLQLIGGVTGGNISGYLGISTIHKYPGTTSYWMDGSLTIGYPCFRMMTINYN